jgi:hypothetical protein
MVIWHFYLIDLHIGVIVQINIQGSMFILILAPNELGMYHGLSQDL